jgi:hypothetical protein
MMMGQIKGIKRQHNRRTVQLQLGSLGNLLSRIIAISLPSPPACRAPPHTAAAAVHDICTAATHSCSRAEDSLGI